MNIQVRPIEDVEYFEASDVVVKVFRELVAASMEAKGAAIFELFASAEKMRSRDAEASTTFVARNEERIVGVLQVRDGNHITLFFTLPALHGQGIGRALLRAADQHQKLRTVNSSTIAVAAYERLGFKVCGPEQVKDGIRFVPMVRDID